MQAVGLHCGSELHAHAYNVARYCDRWASRKGKLAGSRVLSGVCRAGFSTSRWDRFTGIKRYIFSLLLAFSFVRILSGLDIIIVSLIFVIVREIFGWDNFEKLSDRFFARSLL